MQKQFTTRNNSVILISGATRSGKSTWAERMYSKEESVFYIATSSRSEDDTDWQERILRHKLRRPTSWQTIESENNLTRHLYAIPPSSNILIDSLGGYVARNINTSNNYWEDSTNTFLEFISNYVGNIIIVSEEVGWGVSPTTKIGNLFRDRLGILSQQVQNISSESWLVVHGIAININLIGTPV